MAGEPGGSPMFDVARGRFVRGAHRDRQGITGEQPREIRRAPHITASGWIAGRQRRGGRHERRPNCAQGGAERGVRVEVGETLEVVARDAELEILAGEGIEVETISPHRLTGRGTRSILGLGDLVADQVMDVVLRLTFPYGQLGRETGLIVRAIDRTLPVGSGTA